MSSGLPTRVLTTRAGRSLSFTVMGFGAAPIGNMRRALSDDAAEATVRRAWDLGLRYFDTAPLYGHGLSERRVGRALGGEARDSFVLSTKVGRLLEPCPPGEEDAGIYLGVPPLAVRFDYSRDGVMRSFEESLERLGLSRIDILYVHDIGVYQHGAEAHPGLMKTLRESGYRALESLRAGGAIKAFGIGVNEREVLIEAMEWGQWDAFLLAGRYTLLEQAPLDDLLPRCVAAGTSIVVGGPLNSGILAGRDTWNYNPAPPEVVARVKAIAAICDGHRVPLPAAALQFPLAHPAVAAIIPGPRNADEFVQNLALLRHPIPAGLWSDLRQAGLLHPAAPTPETTS